jgi:dienelactone hydrolase
MPIAPGSLDNFRHRPFTHDGMEHDIYYLGEGPGVIILHELPGLTPEVLGLAEQIAAAGFHVAVPCLFGTPGKHAGSFNVLRNSFMICIRREFAALAANKPGTLLEWLRALCRDVHQECGGTGIGVIGLCLTGNFALALVVDEKARVVAPVMGEPSLPLPLSRNARAALHISPEDLETIKENISRENLSVLGLRFSEDRICPRERFARLRQELGSRFEGIEIDSSDSNAFGISRRAHSVLTQDLTDVEGHPTRQALAHVVEFLNKRLHASG